MNRRADNDDLLGDVLSEGTPTDFREAFLGQTLRLARRRRRVRNSSRFITVLAVIAVCAGVLWRNLTPQSTKHESRKPGYELVLTVPLPVSRIVATRPLAIGRIVTSTKTANIVSTIDGKLEIREINDDELLAMAPRPAALVRLGPHELELVIVKLDGKSGAPVN